MASRAILADLDQGVSRVARLWSRTPALVRSERVLFAVQGCFPRFDADSTLLKVVALHSLDSSRTFPVALWAAHVEITLARDGALACGPELVELVAALPDCKRSDRRRALAFASRFAHYFIDADRFPVLDTWTQAELERYLPAVRARAHDYVDFAERHAQLAVALGLSRSRQLGHFLWLAGQHRAWSRNRRTSIQRAARALFESSAPELACLAPLEDRRNVAA